jgi:hypothetical protein
LLYGLLADYGLSIARPFAALFITLVFFSTLYAWLGGSAWVGPSIDWQGLQEGLGYSLNRTLPIAAFADEGSAWRRQLLGHSGEFYGILVRTLATTQTVFSAVLIYLGVMAIRRKFRIT